MLMTNQDAANNNSGSDEDIDKLPDISTLNGFYTDGDTCDQDIFAEMRSNILLASGEHYNRRQSKFYKRIRDTKELSQEQKLRLTKNHTQKICKIYANNVLAANPDVGFTPKDENSLHDMKVTEMHHSVWRDASERYQLEDKKEEWCDSYVQVGEINVKLFWDPNLGNIAGYEPQISPESGNPFLDEYGQMVPDDKRPVMEGEFVFEEVYGFNLLRPPECKDLSKAAWLCIRKMVDKKELLRRYRKDEEKQTKIRSDQDETYVVFDALNGGYKKSVNQTMIREYYFRPSLQFPEGYYYLTTKEGILEEGTLPGGYFPIISRQYDKLKTTPRGRSPIKTMRPYQAEINRAASKMAEHQITLGDDKLLIQNGTKVSAGAALPGVRAINVTGAEPKVLPGRSGEQYLGYMQSQITELYQVMMVDEMSADNNTQLDPYTLLFRAARDKKRFQRNIRGFNRFLVEIASLYLKLAKIHLPDDVLIWKVGKNEQLNISEFRSLPDTCYEINIEEQSEDIETKLGKQLVMNHVLQYVGPQMKPDDIGKILRQMPYANLDESMDDFTLDYDTSVNDMLALDRGEQPPINQYDNHVYMIKRLTSRTRKADFKFLTPQIQQAYFAKIDMHQQFESKNQLAIQRAEAGLIPTSGYLVTCDFYVKDPTDATGVKTRRARVPYDSMEWLINQLEAQGNGQQKLEDMNSGIQAQMAEKFSQGMLPPRNAGPPNPELNKGPVNSPSSLLSVLMKNPQQGQAAVH